jgi:chorismate mutase
MTLPLYFSAKTLGEWNGYRVIAASDEAIRRAVAFMLEDIAQKNGVRPEELTRCVMVVISRELT